MRAFCACSVQHALFEKIIIDLIVLKGIALCLQAFSHLLAELCQRVNKDELLKELRQP